MKINVDESIIAGSFSEDEVDFTNKYFNNGPNTFDGDTAKLDAYNAALANCSDGFKDLYIQAEQAGIRLRFVGEAMEDGSTVLKLDPDVLKQLDEVNLKYKENSLAAKLYDKAQKARIAATKAGTSAGTAHNVMLSLKAGLYKGAAAAANLFNIESLKELGQMALLTIAISALTKVFQELWARAETQGHLLEWAEESANALQETKDEIKSTTEELDSIKERMTELQNMGALSLTEQEELRNLQQQNAELEKKLALLQKTQEVEAREASEDAVKALHTYDKENNIHVTNYGGNAASGDKNVAQQLDEYAAKYREIKAEMADLDLSDPDAQEQWDDLTTKAEEYEKKITDLSNNAQTQLDNIDITTLDDESADYVNDVNNAITGSLQAIGAISTSDALKMQLPEGQYDFFIQQMQALADSEQEVTESSLKQYLGEDIYNAAVTAYGSIDALIEHIKSLQDVDDIVGKVASSDKFAGQGIQGKISDMVNDKDFVITAESITKILGQDFIAACEKAGTSAEAMAEKWNQAREEMADKSIDSVIEGLSDLEDKFESIGSAYNEFATNGVVSAGTLKGLSDAFGEAIGETDEFQNAINVLGSSTSSVEEAEDAVEGLANAYMNSSTVMSKITDETKDLYVTQLKKIGVTNAEEVANFALAKATLKSADADAAAKAAAFELMLQNEQTSNSLISKAYSAASAAQQEDMMRAVEDMIAGSNFSSVMANHKDALYALGAAAGYTSAQIAGVAAAYSVIAKLGNKKNMSWGELSTLTKASNEVADFQLQIQSAMEEFTNAFSGMSFNVGGNFGSSGSGGSGGSGGGGGGSGESKSDKRKNKYDEEKAKLDHKLEMEYISYKTYYKKLDALGKKWLKGKKGNAKDYKEHLETLADVRKSAFDSYKKQLDRSLEKGNLTYDQHYKKLVALGKKWLKKRKGNKEDYQDYLDDLAEARRTAFEAERDELDKKFENGIIGHSTYFKKIKALEKKWLKGRKRTQEDYEKAVEEHRDKMRDWFEDEFDRVLENNDIKTFHQTWIPGEDDAKAIKDYIDELDKAQRNGELRWRDWYELRHKAEKELADAKKEAYEAEQDSINDIIDLVSDMLKQEKEDMIDALNDQKDKYAEIVDAKKEALDLTRAQLDYEKEIRDMNRDLSEMQAKAAVLRLDTSREGQAKYKALMEEIREKQEEIAEKQDDHAYDASIEALDESLEEYEEKLEKKIEDIEELMNHQGEWLKYVYSYINSTDPSTLLNRLVGYNDQYGTGIAADVHDMWANYENVRNKYLGEKVEDIIAAIREAAKAAENGEVEDTDLDGDGIADNSANYGTIGKLIYQLSQNVSNMRKAKAADDFETYEKLDKANQNITQKISDISNGTYDDLKQVSDYKWTTKAGTDLFDMISYNEDLGTAGMTAVSIINKMKNEPDVAMRNKYAAELRKIHGYENLFYDKTTGYWYKSPTDYKNQKVLFDKEGNTGIEKDFTLTGKEGAADIVKAIKENYARGSIGYRAVKQLTTTLKKFSNYKNAWWDTSTQHVYKNATDFYNLETIDSGKVGTHTHAGATRVIKAMQATGDPDGAVAKALANILKTKFKSYNDLAYDSKSKKWKYTKNKKKVNLYHTGLDAGFVSDGSYLPSPKQSELYALLQKGELVLNKTDQDRLMVQMQVLSGLQDSIKKMTQTASASAGISTQPIVINLDQPIIINGNADKSTVDLLKKQSQAITNQTLNTLQDALKMRGFNGRVQSNRK